LLLVISPGKDHLPAPLDLNCKEAVPALSAGKEVVE
jgi:hypothetical protein